MNHALIRMRTQFRTVAAFLFVAILQLPIALGEGFLEPEGSSYRTDDGTVPLVWGETERNLSEDRVYEVRRWGLDASGPGQLVYEGEDTASFVSGLGEGDYVFRIRSKAKGEAYPDWGDEGLNVTIDYIDMAIVWPLMGAGALSFVVLIGTIALGRRATEGSESS